MVEYAQKKVASVRRLRHTSLPIPHAGATYPAKSLISILGGLLTVDSDWGPSSGAPLERTLAVTDELERLEKGLRCRAWALHRRSVRQDLLLHE